MDLYRFLPLRFYIDLLIDVLFSSNTVLSFQLLLAIKLFGVSDSVKTNGEAAIPSSPVKPVAQTGVSSGDDNPMKSKGATAESKSPIKPIGKTGASFSLNLGVRGRASVSSGNKGKAIVFDNVGEVITFKDVTFGPHEDEVRFWLIHFWEAWNVQTKVLIGLEMLLIDEELNQPQQPPQQLAVSTAQPATSISTEGSSTSGVTNVYKLSKAELISYQLTRIEEPEEHIDPDYLHYLRAIGAYDSFQQQSA
ncbi:hypothetical protein DY000_02030803 [Brassica cretica]|uniref:Uncharacterized protein n=1 Tax=Brassica cretica TaxID=69181 RepID=A0ABQ7DQB8_BRACR|nr:hypothetical protein DY000_02030803 [Brassica cretica]